MIVVLSNGMELRVTFKHFTKKENENSRLGTFCEINSYIGEKHIDGSAGEAIVHPKDNFSRAKGRLVSLKRALENGFNDKDIRAEVWNAYNTWRVPYGSLTRINKVIYLPEDELVE